MIYLQQLNVTDLIECVDAAAALDVIRERGILPNAIRIWSAAEPMVSIDFETLQQMMGHSPLDHETVRDEVDGFLARFREGLLIEGMGMRAIGMDVSTSGIPSGDSAVRRVYGNPAARIEGWIHGVNENEGKAIDPVGPARIMGLIEDWDGWGLVHSTCSPTFTPIQGVPCRTLTMYVSKLRSEFDTA